MAFFDRMYDVYAVFGGSEGRVPWAEPQWSSVAAALDPLIAAAGAPVAVRSCQLAPKPGSPNQRAISFGRIGWNAKGHAKWTHPANQTGDSAFFMSSEVWAPSWSACERRDRSPDVHVNLGNAGMFEIESSAPASVIFAVAKDSPLPMGAAAYPAAQAISAAIAGCGIAYAFRPWGEAFGAGAYTNALQDLRDYQLFAEPSGRRNPRGAELVRGWRWLE